MALAADHTHEAFDTANHSDRGMTRIALRTLRPIFALALMATAANCFLKYLWWTACYSAWSGIPKMAAQYRAAGARSSFYGWSVVVLELATFAVIYATIHVRSVSSPLVRTGFRLAASLTFTIVGTGLLALALSWIKQGH